MENLVSVIVVIFILFGIIARIKRIIPKDIGNNTPGAQGASGTQGVQGHPSMYRDEQTSTRDTFYKKEEGMLDRPNQLSSMDFYPMPDGKNRTGSKTELAKKIMPAITSMPTLAKIAKIASVQKADETMTAFLSRKADEGQKSQVAEDRKEELFRRQEATSLRIAGRLNFADPIPNGSRVEICGYCGAENLVPMNSFEPYKCYFCREKLSSRRF